MGNRVFANGQTILKINNFLEISKNGEKNLTYYKSKKITDSIWEAIVDQSKNYPKNMDDFEAEFYFDEVLNQCDINFVEFKDQIKNIYGEKAVIILGKSFYSFNN